MSTTRRRPAARKRDDDLARNLAISARLWRVELATAAVAFLTYATYGLGPLAAIALLLGLPLAAVHIADGAHHRPGWRRRIGWHPYGWPRAFAQRTVSATLRQLGRRLKRCPRWLDEIARVGHWICRPYSNQQLRRHWWHAMEAAGLPQARIRRITPTRAGVRLDLVMPDGCPAGWLHDHSEHIATTLRARQVRVARDPANAALAVAHITYRDPFAQLAGRPWPLLGTDHANVWDPVPVGIDEDGQTVTLNLFTPGHGAHSLLLGGIPGSGKSTTINMLAATVARDPNCTVLLIDGKHPGQKAWQQTAATFTGGTDAADANRVLEHAKTWMEQSLQRLDQEDRDQVRPGDPVAVLIFDETSTYFTGGKSKTAELLERLVKQGRAPGLAIIAATQKPEARSIPTGLRDNVDSRIAHNVMAATASDTILGQGMAAAGYDASQLSEDQKGVGLLSRGGTPFTFRTFYVSAQDARAIAARAAELHPPNVGNAGVAPASRLDPTVGAQGAGGEFPGEETPEGGSAPLVGSSPPGAPAHEPGGNEGGVAAPVFPGRGDWLDWYRTVYLRSEHWERLRAETVSRRGRRCDECSATGSVDVHHLFYGRLGEERDEDLQVLCRSCHETVHVQAKAERKVRRFRLEMELRDHPECSDREIARRVGCDHKTVGAARRRLA